MLTPEPIWVNGTRVQAEVTGADQLPEDAEPVMGYRDSREDEARFTPAELDEEIVIGYMWPAPSAPDQWAAWSPVVGEVLNYAGEEAHVDQMFATDELRAAYQRRYIRPKVMTALCDLVESGVHGRLHSATDAGRLALVDPSGPGYGPGARYIPTYFAVRLVHAYRSATTMTMPMTGELNGEWVLETISSQMDGIDDDTQQAVVDEYEQALTDAAHEIGGITWQLTRNQVIYPMYSDIDPEEVCARAVERVDAWEIIARHTGQ